MDFEFVRIEVQSTRRWTIEIDVTYLNFVIFKCYKTKVS